MNSPLRNLEGMKEPESGAGWGEEGDTPFCRSSSQNLDLLPTFLELSEVLSVVIPETLT